MTSDEFNRVVFNASEINDSQIQLLFTKTLETGQVFKRKEKKSDSDWLCCLAPWILLGRIECRWTRLPSHTNP